MEGMDNAPEMLDLLRTRARDAGIEPTLHLSDLRDPLPGTYEAILVPAFTLQLVDHPLPVLDSLVSSLAPGGALYLTLFIPHAELDGDTPEGQWHRDRELILPDGHQATVDTCYHITPEDRHLRRQHHYRIRNGQGEVIDEHRCEETIGWFEPHEVIAHLEDRGCKVLDAIADFDPDSECPLDEATVFTLTARRSG